jgi:hypothetical protein
MRVELNGHTPSPLSPGACILHRLATWALFLANELTYREGKLVRTGITTDAGSDGRPRFWVPLEGRGQRAYDEVILRHGPTGRLCDLPHIDAAFQGVVEAGYRDRTRKQMYPDGFFPDQRPRSSPSPQVQIVPTPAQISDPRRMDESAGRPDPPTGVRFGQHERSVTGQPVAPFLVELVGTLGELRSQTHAKNFDQAEDAARRLDDLLIRHRPLVGRDLWLEANSALFYFEDFRRLRAQSGGTAPDLTRLEELLQRLENG